MVPRSTHWPVVLATLVAGLSLSPRPSSADIYTYVDKAGVVHFTNIRPRGRKWKRLMRTGPGKARSVHAPRSAHPSPDRYVRYDRHIEEAAELYQIPVALVRAVIRIESDFTPGVVSRVGAQGMMQLMPNTAIEMGVDDPFDARSNILGGTRYLRVLANQFDGDLVRTLAAYHAGPAKVNRYGGMPPYRTTYRYVRLVLDRYYRYRRRLEVGREESKKEVPTPS